jgi:hypothetical protein
MERGLGGEVHPHHRRSLPPHPTANTSSARGINSKIERVKKRANGFRKPEHFITAILFHCGGLELDPVATH